MVALTQSLQSHSASPDDSEMKASLPTTPLAQPPETWEEATRSREAREMTFSVERDAEGNIVAVTIGGRRAIRSSQQRRIKSVRQLAPQRIVVGMEMHCEFASTPTAIIWQLYDGRGRLAASAQLTPDGKHALLTNYDLRRVSRLAKGDGGQLCEVEQWNI